MGVIDVLILFKVEKSFSEIVFVAGAIKMISIKCMTFEVGRHFLQDRCYLCKRKGLFDDKEITGRPNT